MKQYNVPQKDGVLIEGELHMVSVLLQKMDMEEKNTLDRAELTKIYGWLTTQYEECKRRNTPA